MIRYIALFILMGFYLTACDDSGIMKTEDYIGSFSSENYVYQNVQELNALKYQVRIQPLDYLIVKQWPDLDKESFQAKKEEFDETELILKYEIITPEGSSAIKYGHINIDETRNRIQLLNQELEDLFTLSVNNRNFKCKMAFLERKYDYSNKLTLNLSFKTEGFSTNDNIILTYEDEIYDNGTIKLSVSEELKHIPTLKIK